MSSNTNESPRQRVDCEIVQRTRFAPDGTEEHWLAEQALIETSMPSHPAGRFPAHPAGLAFDAPTREETPVVYWDWEAKALVWQVQTKKAMPAGTPVFTEWEADFTEWEADAQLGLPKHWASSSHPVVACCSEAGTLSIILGRKGEITPSQAALVPLLIAQGSIRLSPPRPIRELADGSEDIQSQLTKLVRALADASPDVRAAAAAALVPEIWRGVAEQIRELLTSSGEGVRWLVDQFVSLRRVMRRALEGAPVMRLGPVVPQPASGSYRTGRWVATVSRPPDLPDGVPVPEDVHGEAAASATPRWTGNEFSIGPVVLSAGGQQWTAVAEGECFVADTPRTATVIVRLRPASSDSAAMPREGWQVLLLDPHREEPLRAGRTDRTGTVRFDALPPASITPLSFAITAVPED
jgi:hypothetical protein